MLVGALRAPVSSAPRRGQGLPPLPRTPFSASGISSFASLRTVSLDEAEHFAAQSRCQRRYAPMVFGIIPESRSDSFRNKRSASPESPGKVFKAIAFFDTREFDEFWARVAPMK